MHLEFKFDTTAIQNKFKKLAELNKTDGITRKVANVLWQESERAFDEESSPEGKSWAALDPQYRAWRDKQGYDGKKLQMRGDLVNSLNIDYGDNFAMIGAAEPYGQYHQAGTSKMQARPFLGIGNEGIEEIKHILHKALKQAIDK